MIPTPRKRMEIWVQECRQWFKRRLYVRRRKSSEGGKRRGNKATNVEKVCLGGQKLGEASVREMENREIHPFLGIFVHTSKTNSPVMTQKTQKLSVRCCIWSYGVIKLI